MPDNVVDLPGVSRLPHSARPVRSTRGKPIFAVTDPSDPAYGLWFDERPIAPLPYLADVLARRDAEGIQRGVLYLLAARPDGPRHMITDAELSGGQWIGKLSMPMPEDKPLREAVTTVIRGMAEGRVPTEAEARWEGDRLVMPPAEALPAGYLETAGDSATALRNWRDVAELACRAGAENCALNMGASYAGPYVRPLSRVRPVSALWAGIGEPRRGKTTNANTAAAIYGSPIRVNPVLSESTVAIGDQLAGLGCLPFFRDEVHAAGWTPAQWKTYVMRTLNGAGRRRSASDGSGVVRSSREWWGFQFMSGNVDPRYGATDGVQARVVVLGDPHMPDAATADRVTDLLGQSFGWPFRWFLDSHPSPEAFRAYISRAEADLAALVEIPGGSAQTVAGTLALAVAGAELLGAVVGVPALRGAALRSAGRVLATLADAIVDQAARFDDQLYEAVWSDVCDHPGLWPTKSEYEDALQGKAFTRKANDVHGVRHLLSGKPVVSMFVKPFRSLTAPLDLAVDQALSDLRARELLIASAKMGYQHKISVAGLGKANAYTFRVPAEDDGQAATVAVVPEQRAAEPAAPIELPMPQAGPCGAGCGFDASDTWYDGQPWHTGCLDAHLLNLAATQVSAPVTVPPAKSAVAKKPSSQGVPADELARAARVIRDPEGGWPDASDADIATAYAMFQQATAVPSLETLAEGVRMIGDPGYVGTKWLQCLRDGYSGSVTTGALDSELVESVSTGGNLLRYLDHIRADADPASMTGLAILDVRGAYNASALNTELGHGAPSHYTTARSVRAVTSQPKWSKAPGYVLLAKTPKFTVPVPASMAELTAGSWLANPLADLLLNPWPNHGPLIKGELAVAELVYWHRGDYGRRLNRFAEAARDAAYALEALDTVPARYAAHLVKRVRNALLGGYLRSGKYNRNPELIRLDWSDMVVSQTSANVARKTLRATVERQAPEPVGIYRDDIWYADASPAALAHEIVPGKIGKLKVKGVVPMTDPLATAIKDRSPYNVSTVLAAALRGER